MIRRWFLGILILVMIVGILVIFLNQRQALGAPHQPIAYSHKTHVQAGIQCLYCHSEASRSPIAGVPSLQKCMGCHSTIATESEQIKDLKSNYEHEESISWNRVNDQPDFVYFSHQPHVGAGVNCETCHGDIGQMDTTRPMEKMDMGWCLKCHEKQESEKIARLVDCLICRK